LLLLATNGVCYATPEDRQIAVAARSTTVRFRSEIAGICREASRETNRDKLRALVEEIDLRFDEHHKQQVLKRNLALSGLALSAAQTDRKAR
jgi:hypothetical protein